jgi:hypothetical protein
MADDVPDRIFIDKDTKNDEHGGWITNPANPSQWQAFVPASKRTKSETDHLLLMLAEECAEVIQRITKAQRWGLHEVQPGQALNNEQRIRYEVNDLYAVIDLLYERRGVVLFRDNEQVIAKKAKVLHFMEYARQIGELE